jgi:hypothetical protein
MDWKEAAKWVGILVAAGLISTAIELFIEWKLTGPAVVTAARAEARAEVDRVISAALQQSHARAPVKPSSTPQPKMYTPPQTEQGYIYQL